MKIKRITFFTLVIASLLAAANIEKAASEELKEKSETTQEKIPKIIKIEFEDSWAWLAVPEVEQGDTIPMVVALHGDEGHPDNMIRFWKSLWQERQNFILLAPECPRGLCDKGGVNTWSAGGYENSDVQGEWLKALINEVSGAYSVDTDRIYAVGYSGGSIFLGYQGFKMFQDVFAGIQWFCGGVNETEEQVYRKPDNPDCKVPGRVIISKEGDVYYLITAADRIIEILKNNGHKYDYLDTGCRGHCCDAHKYSENALDWFLALPPKCSQ